jgi:hypothetical protein
MKGCISVVDNELVGVFSCRPITASLPSVLIYVILSERFNQLYFTSYSIVLKKKFYHIELNAFASRFAKKGQGLMKCLEPQNCWIAEADG